MSLLYSTDRTILRNLDLTEKLVNSSQFKWHEMLIAAREKGVSDAHFRTFMKEESGFGDFDLLLFDCMKAGILKVETEKAGTKAHAAGADEASDDEMTAEDQKIADSIETVEEKTSDTAYSYSLDPNDKRLKKMLLDYAEKHPMLTTDEQVAKEENPLFALLRESEKTAVPIHGLEDAILGLSDEAEIIRRNHLDAEKQAQNLRKITDDARDFDENRTTRQSKAENCQTHGNEIMRGLKEAIIAHRNRSVFFAVFHPFKFHEERQSIKNAKDMLVTLGAEKEKVDDFAEKVEIQDIVLRDQNKITHAKNIESFYLNVRFDTLMPPEEFTQSDLRDLAEDEPSIPEEEAALDEAFTEGLRIVIDEAEKGKTVVEEKHDPVPQRQMQSDGKEATTEVTENVL